MCVTQPVCLCLSKSSLSSITRKILEKDETPIRFNLLPRFPHLPCRAGTTTPFPPAFSIFIPPGEAHKGKPLLTIPSPHHVIAINASNTPANKPVLSLVFVCGSNKQHGNQKPQNTPSPTPPTTPHPEPKPDAIPQG